MRKFMDLINEAINEDSLIDKSYTPDSYEDKDAEHYEARRKTGFFGAQASGAILMAKSTGRIMLVLRSAQVDQPFTWGNCGGAHSSDERPMEAALREVREETGYTGSIKMIPLFIFKKDTFRYSNFLAIVDDEFAPHLGWEADRAVWVEYGRWPKPLHFGMAGLFGDAQSAKTIQHYAQMFKNGDHAIESVEEDFDLPGGVDVNKAVKAAGDVAKDLSDESDAEAAAASNNTLVAPNTPDAAPADPKAPPTKKSLAPIKPQ